MFSKLIKDRKGLLVLFFSELLIALLAFGTICYLNYFRSEIDITKYFINGLMLYFILVLFVDFLVIIRICKNFEKYLDRSDVQIATIFGNEVAPVFEFGNIVIFVYNEAYEVIWMSQTTLLNKEDIVGEKIYEIIPNFDDLAQKEKNREIFSSIGGKTFQLEINSGLKVVYLKDVSSQYIKNERIESERLFLGHIVIDNYQDISVSLNEVEFSLYVTEIKEAILAWTKQYNLFIRSYGNDSYLIIGEEANYQQMKKDGFSIIEKIRTRAIENENPLTISIGIGKGNTTSVLRTSELSYMALNMALSRGGDQVVVNDFGKQLEYYGAKNEVKQTRSHVRGRVLATSLANLIKIHNNVLITGHINSDFDAIGASLGILSICKSLNVKAFVVYDDESVDVQAKRAIRDVFNPVEIADMTISPSKALQIANDQTLLIVVDTHRPESLLQPKLLEKCQEVCVIDHHRKGDSFIENPIFQYHEPQSSSASELVAELIYYQPTKIDVSEEIANFLLAGICLDTKFFKSGTSGKTFEMSMILKNYQASVEKVNDFFKEEYEEMKLISGIVSTSKAVATGVYVATCDEDDIVTKSALSKAAEEILSTKGVQAIFVVGRTRNNEVSVSARSTSDFNVQRIMEEMGGGGHFSKAATQINGTNITNVLGTLEEKISVFLRDEGK